jgi:hypothetical protein
MSFNDILNDFAHTVNGQFIFNLSVTPSWILSDQSNDQVFKILINSGMATIILSESQDPSHGQIDDGD